jgi:hypothetical protein
MSKNPNSILIVNQLYKQPLNLFQEEEIRKHKDLGGIVNIRSNVRNTEMPYFEYVALKENRFARTEQAPEMPQPSGPGYIAGFGFYAGGEVVN